MGLNYGKDVFRQSHQGKDMRYKDRLEHPVIFLESMLGNFEKPQFQQARNFTLDLIEVINALEVGRLETWLKNINFDPENLGSAFNMVHQFAEDYLQKMKIDKR